VAAQPGVSDAQAAKAVYGRGVALVRLGQDRAGIDVLEQMAQRFPGTPDAADGLFRGGRIRESLADLDGAAGAYAAVIALPAGGGARGLDAQFRLAFVQFRQGRFSEAADGWRALAARAAQPDARAQALFWLGKALSAAGDTAGARAAWTSATAAAPATYYALRAADLLAAPSVSQPTSRPSPAQPAAAATVGGREASPRADVDRTLPLVESHADDAPDPPLGATLAADPALDRAQQLLALGLRREAIWVLDDLAGRLGDTSTVAQLGAWEQSRGLYYPALVLGLSVHAKRLMYPLPHPVALAEAARQQHVDPLLFAALMLQESNMDQSVESAAQARGLSQLIASTAYEAARALGRYDFQATQLFQPQTSITLGAYTFEQRLARYDQQILPALAAYNASAYAVDGWLLAANTSDIDTFAEAIPFTETYPYVQRIYENYRQYLDLYGP
jgi:soluble lytic murein transglycosylase